MIRLLYDTTIGGLRVGKGSILDLEDSEEATLIAEGDATRTIDFASTNLLPRPIYQSNAPLTISSDNAGDTAFRNAGSIVIPGGTMNLNGELVIVSAFDATPDAATSAKTINLLWGGTNIGGPGFTGNTQRSIEIMTRIKNANSLTTQKVHNTANYGVASTVHITTTKDTAGDVTFQLQGKWNANVVGETLVQIGLSCWYYPGLT